MPADTDNETFFDLVVTRSGADCPRFIQGSRSPELFVASGRHATWLFRPQQGLTTPRTRIQYAGERCAVTVNATTEEDILRVLRNSGVHYSAFGEERSYPPTEARIIRFWEQEAGRASGPLIDTVSEARQEGRFVWLHVPPGESNWHRRWVSHGIVVMRTEEAARLFLDYLKIPRVHCLSSNHIEAFVFDPDLALGDYGIDARNEDALPEPLRSSVKRFLADEAQGEFDAIMSGESIVPTEFPAKLFSAALS